MSVRPILSALIVICLGSRVFATSEPGAMSYDVVVYGATGAGVMTSIAAARHGAHVILLEPEKHVGGMISGGLSRTDYGNKKVIGGLALEFYRRLGTYYKHPIDWFPEPHVAESVLLQMLKTAKVDVRFQSRLQEHGAVETSGTRIARITLEDGSRVSGKVFVDCSYEGDLMGEAGIRYTWGREEVAKYDESLAGIRKKTPFHQFQVNVKARDANGKLLPEIQPEPKGEPGSADKRVQAYNFRICMTTDTKNMVPFPKPPDYNPARYQLLANMINIWTSKKGMPPKLTQMMAPRSIENNKVDCNNKGAFSTDYIGGSARYPTASYAERTKIWNDHYNYQAGFLYFLGHDPQVPQILRDEINNWGLAKDEFVDSNNWPSQLYIREGRRMEGEFVMTQADIQTSRTKADSIGMGSYNSDSHNVQRFENSKGFAENEGDVEVHVSSYEIPYRVMLPKTDQCENLLVPVCLSASHVVYSTLRMEPQYMIIGEAAGNAAAIAAQGNSNVHHVSVSALQAILQENHAILHTR